jgi:hypothetical protein
MRPLESGRETRRPWIPVLGATALEAVGANYTGGLQEGGPMLVENLLSVTSYAPGPALRPPCAAAAASMLWTQTSPTPRQLVRLIIRWRRWAGAVRRCELAEG